MVKKVLQKLTTKEDLSYDEAYSLILAIKNDELSEVQIGGFQVALLMKGPTITEITAIAQAMRDHCEKISPRVEADLMDTCGTGGGLSTFNISTAVALVAAAAGIPVAKHGSRSISSLSGSADVLEALGVEINLSPQAVESIIEQVGICFIYAPLFHPVMHKVLPPDITHSTLGPQTHPARANRLIIVVYKPELPEVVTEVALSLVYKHALFVHGLDGLDEISLLGKTRINEIHNGAIKSYEISPEDYGLTRCALEDIYTGTPAQNASVIRDVFSGRNLGPRRDAVIINAAGALYVGGVAASLAEGVKMAGELIDSGAAQDKLNQLIVVSKDFRSIA